MRILLALAILLITAFLLSPGYLELEVSVVPHKGGGPFWWESHRTELALDDSAGVLYVSRRSARPMRIPNNGKPSPT